MANVLCLIIGAGLATMVATWRTNRLHDRIGRLESWKAQGMECLNSWHRLEDLVPQEFRLGRLGQSWPDVVAAYIRFLKAVR